MNINRLGANLRGLGRAAVELVYPRNCQFCTSALDESCAGVICPDCLRGVRFIEPPFCERCALPFDGQPAEVYACGHCRDRVFQFRRALAACTAESIVREAIHRFKYQGEMYWAVHLEEWLVGAAWRWIDWDAVDAIVPVPLHPRKHREREFNQAEILARALARASGKPLWRRALRRVRDTETQTHLSAPAPA